MGSSAVKLQHVQLFTCYHGCKRHRHCHMLAGAAGSSRNTYAETALNPHHLV
jgi:hypothetical protein